MSETTRETETLYIVDRKGWLGEPDWIQVCWRDDFDTAVSAYQALLGDRPEQGFRLRKVVTETITVVDVTTDKVLFHTPGEGS